MTGARLDGQALGLTALGLLGWMALLWIMGLDLLHALALGAVVLALIGLRRAPVVNTDRTDAPDSSANERVSVC